MASNPSIFLDDGGVMNDNALRGAQWQRLVGEFLAPRLGGDPEARAQANKVVAERMWRRYQEEVWGGQVDDYLSYPGPGPLGLAPGHVPARGGAGARPYTVPGAGHREQSVCYQEGPCFLPGSDRRYPQAPRQGVPALHGIRRGLR